MKTWSQLAVEFTKSLERYGPRTVGSAVADPPLTIDEMDAIEELFEIPVPDSLREFLLNDSSSCKCRYYVSIPRRPTNLLLNLAGDQIANSLAAHNVYGGATICNSERFERWNSDDTKSAYEDAGFEEVWDTFIFSSLQNGDALGLNCSNDSIDPPVVYIDHEGCSNKQLAPTLNDFLYQWQRLGYIGPEYWMIEDFIDSGMDGLNWQLGKDSEDVSILVSVAG